MSPAQIRNLSDAKLIAYLDEARNYSKSDGYAELITLLESEVARRGGW